MDKTKKYIKMCIEAEEIQEEWKCRELDIYQYSVSKRLTYIDDIDGHAKRKSIGCFKLHKIWLPQQDQLQQMYLDNRRYKINCGQMSMFFENWRHDELRRCGEDLISYSMEPLWLCLVMKVLYNKVWNGKRWEEIK